MPEPVDEFRNVEQIDVANLLSEIREKVRSAHGSLGRVDSDPERGHESLDQIKSHLITTRRTFSNLPPVHSNRNGIVSTVELWIKGKIKRATHWFTIDQVNFNSSVNQSLAEIYELLADHDARLVALSSRVVVLEQTKGGLAELNHALTLSIREMRQDIGKLAAVVDDLAVIPIPERSSKSQ